MPDAFYIAEDGEIRAFERVAPHLLLHADGRIDGLWKRPGAFVAGRAYRKLWLSQECEAGIRRLLAERDEARRLLVEFGWAIEPCPSYTSVKPFSAACFLMSAAPSVQTCASRQTSEPSFLPLR